jgi:hypothetical protein
LVLGAGGDTAGNSEMGQQLLHYGSPYRVRMPDAVKVAVAFDPMNVALLGAVGKVFNASNMPDLVEQSHVRPRND